ncbi:hypothetical protein [Shewanella halifaxensis]|uniref:hypothetical protein n=1 Tax=Shewanella halifaxensis TaxID=271098 RepID=UPI00059EBBDA|nr:hypothetical protein [Shewanella halifaxensis]
MEALFRFGYKADQNPRVPVSNVSLKVSYPNAIHRKARYFIAGFLLFVIYKKNLSVPVFKVCSKSAIRALHLEKGLPLLFVKSGAHFHLDKILRKVIVRARAKAHLLSLENSIWVTGL